MVDDQAGHSRLAVLGTVAFYMVVAISMTLLNKAVLTSTPLPVFLLLCQSGVAVILLATENRLGPMKTPKFNIEVAKQLMPLCGVNVLGLTFNNYCLQYVDASFHQVARGLVLPCTILVSVVVLRQYPSALSLTAALTVTSGFFSGVLLDPSPSSSNPTSHSHASTLGPLFGVLSSLSSACHAVLIKRGLSTVQNSPIALSYYNNILSTAALVPLVILSGEAGGALRLLQGTERATFFWGAGITGFFGFLISFASFLSIKVTSPVTHMISSAARGVLQTILAVYIFHDVLSRGRIISIFLIISGSVLYVYAKEKEAKQAKPQKVPIDLRKLERGGDSEVLFDEKDEKF
ncbi:hypothetical protein BCR39DRAFT_538287 [Naematelia encephala]|uniref:Sugar phosphate transporter domain-containing protein n=1 Tax=Naematelia encephala TaxID=71784 RepID=A0A1Y2AYD6_9TREE|nr:hypothetical protein BCR39DRAFT_538287 [Naematelia encephala]